MDPGGCAATSSASQHNCFLRSRPGGSRSQIARRSVMSAARRIAASSIVLVSYLKLST
jgi:hypothetical protein